MLVSTTERTMKPLNLKDREETERGRRTWERGRRGEREKEEREKEGNNFRKRKR